jgi:5,10-methylenetetrahydromethanopterin reductase
MKFGVLLFRGLFGVKLLDGGLPAILKLTQRAEELGYDSAWISEESWWSPDSVTYATLMVEETRKIRIGTMGSNPYVRHPLSLALAFHTFGEIAGERGIVGISAGSEARLNKLGLKRTEPLATVRESIELMRRLSEGKPIEFDGQNIKVAGVNPSWIKNDLNIYICANGPKMMELAGRVADGAVLAHFPPSYTGWAMKHVKKGLDESGRSRSRFEYAVQPIVFVNENRVDAFKAARDYFQFLPPPIALAEPSILDKCGFAENEVELIRGAFREAFSSPASKLPQGIIDKIVEKFAITGTPSEAITKIKEYEESGIDHVIIGFIPNGDIGEKLSVFRDKVIEKL